MATTRVGFWIWIWHERHWHLYKSTIQPCLEYCCYFWAGATGCYLDILGKLEKQVSRTVDPSLTASLEPLVHCQNVANLILFDSYYFCINLSELDELISRIITLVAGALVILIGASFLSPFLDVIRMSISTVSSLTQLESGIYCLELMFFFGQ